MRVALFLICGLVSLSACGGAIDDGTNGAGRNRPPSAALDPTRGNSNGGTSSSRDGGSTRPSAPERVCNSVRPLLEDFEKALDPSWSVTNPSGLNLDAQQPIAGAQSLKLSLKPGAQPYLTIPLPSVCRLEITLKVRPDAQLLGSDRTDLVRVNADPTFYHLVLNKGGTLEFVHEYHDSWGPGLGGGSPYGKLLPDTITTIVLNIDTVRRQFTGSATTDGLPPGYLSAASVVESGSITSIDIGSAPGWMVHVDYAPDWAAAPSGAYWLDDLSLR